jgi:outer membrane receptor protein involved in Fe transport
VKNYEMGVKFHALGNRLYVEATVFNIDWKGIQARLFGPAPSYYSYVSNAGSANISGVELAATAQLARFASFSTSATLQDARLTAFLPDTFAVGGGYASGSVLPGSRAGRWPTTSSSNSPMLRSNRRSKWPTAIFPRRRWPLATPPRAAISTSSICAPG